MTEPIQSILLIIFFLSIGLLIDFDFLTGNVLAVSLLVLSAITIKSILNVMLLRLAGRPWEQAFPGGLIMAQIGEFSFVLAAAGIANGLLDTNAYKLAVATIAISLLVSPLWMSLVRNFQDIATHGITDFRAALGETLESEVEQLGRGRTMLRWQMRTGRRRMKRVFSAMGAAAQNARSRRNRAAAPESEKQPDPIVPLATADAYPVEEEDLFRRRTTDEDEH